MRTKIISLIFLVLAAVTAASAQASGPAETVAAFYKHSNARSSTFNNRHIQARKQWYTPALYNLFLLELKKEKAMLKAHPDDKPFFGDGLTFRPDDELCEANGKSYERTQSYGRVSRGKTRSYVDVKFAYPKACNIEPILYRVNLQKIDRKWLISDWTYSSGVTLTREMRENKY